MVTGHATASPPVAGDPSALDRLASLARRAGEAILPHYRPGLVAEQKGDRGPVTVADRAAHDVIVAGLAAWDPATPVISEEGEVPDAATRAGWSRFWLVDPLDGTKEFLQRNGEFTVNIALIEAGRPILGVVFAPALDLLYLAGEGLGAWREGAGRSRVRLASRPPAPGQPLRVAESRSHPSAELEAWLRTVPVAERIPAGSSLKFCWLAEGRVDVYPRFGATMEWDVAAGDCVFRQSGADGPRVSPLEYNRPDLRIPGFVVGLDR